jgi:GntR family transcriptional repressor for pyruvate dehydrogenase complex
VSVTNEAILQIKQLIVSGEISPGEKLPKESELAIRLGSLAARFARL